MNIRTTCVVLLLGAIAIVYFLTPTHVTRSSAPVKPSSPVVQHRSMFPRSASPSHRVQGSPTVTASFIDHVLNRAHSPAQGIGTVMYKQGVEYGIDPVYALAFFHHESSFGLAGVARSTHSIGNIRCTQGYACDPTGGYRSYPSYAVAVTDWYQLLSSVYIAHGLDTVETIIPTYAPNADHNNESAYIASVNADVAQWRHGEV